MKTITCIVHGIITLPDYIVKIIDSIEFQRLRNIKQLGFCSYVYPNANHTRFEHSLGTYNITRMMTHKIASLAPNREYYVDIYSKNIKLNEHFSSCIEIAGLLHDVGHGPYGHFFDDIVLENYNGPNKTHEERSERILEIIIKKYLSYKYSDLDIEFMKSVINPRNNQTGILFQIVSNKNNGIDSDKLDYLSRDSYYTCATKYFNFTRIVNSILLHENEICFRENVLEELNGLYSMRKSMHRKVYGHATIKLIEKMYFDIYSHLKKDFNFENYLDDMEKFIELDDNTMFNYISFCKLSMVTSQEIHKNIINSFTEKTINETNVDQPIKITIENKMVYNSDKVYVLHKRFLSRDKYIKQNIYTKDEITNHLLASEYPYIKRTIKNPSSKNVKLIDNNGNVSKKKLDTQIFDEEVETIFITYSETS